MEFVHSLGSPVAYKKKFFLKQPGQSLFFEKRRRSENTVRQKPGATGPVGFVCRWVTTATRQLHSDAFCLACTPASGGGAALWSSVVFLCLLWAFHHSQLLLKTGKGGGGGSERNDKGLVYLMLCETHSSYEGGKNDKRRERNKAREEEKMKQCRVKKMKTEWNETLLTCTNIASSENTGTGEKEIRWGWEWKVTAVQIRTNCNNVRCVPELNFEMKFSTTNTITISPHFHQKCTHKAAYLIIQSRWLIETGNGREGTWSLACSSSSLSYSLVTDSACFFMDSKSTLARYSSVKQMDDAVMPIF